MKKIFTLFLMVLITLSSLTVISADSISWEDAVKKAINNSNSSSFTLMDVSGDGVPELFCPSGNGVVSYSFDGNALAKASDDASIPYEFVERLIKVRNTDTNELHYMGQTVHAGYITTYKISFLNCAPILEVISQENPLTGTGKFKGDGNALVDYEDVGERVTDYLKGFTREHLMKCSMELSEVRRYGKARTTERFLGRYRVLSEFPDDSYRFSSSQREAMKKNIGKGKFLGFDKISVLNDDVIFIEYFTNNTSKNKFDFAYDKQYSLVSGKYDIIDTYEQEKDLDYEYLWSLLSPDARPSNFKPEYSKTSDFRGIDDYVTYFSSLLPDNDKINEKGKKEVASFMEFAVNKCSRTKLRAVDNVLTVKASDVSIISQNASNSMGQLRSVCSSKGIEQIRTAKTVPEFVCVGVDFSKPVRCEFEKGVASAIGQASGIRIMLDDGLGIYVNSAELSVLENETDIFAIEFIKNKQDYSIVFTDKTNETFSSVSVPVWFIVPAKSDYSSVLSSFDGGTENRGGQYDELYQIIEFSATRSGNYQVLEEDITINDINSTSFISVQAIRFLVSKGVLEVDRNNNFYPDKNMSRYDFTKALVSMFYTINENIECSYTDVSSENRYFPYVATAEEMGMAKPLSDGTFGGKEAVTNEYILSICGKVLAEKKGYKFPENYVEYLSFLDKSSISASAMPYIAVAVQCGLWENDGELLPDDAVTREKGAQILYKTFTLLYDTSPVTTSFSAVVESNKATQTLNDLTPVQRVVICALFTALVSLAFWLLSKKRKPYKENQQ